MEKTIERLAMFRRLLINQAKTGKTHVFSHQLAEMAGTSAAIVRRDLMNLGYYGTPRHGYEIKALLECLDKFFHKQEIKNIILVGVGNLGRALISYFAKDKSEFDLVAAFDTDPLKSSLKFNGCPCYGLEKLPAIVSDKKVEVGIITVPGDHAQATCDLLANNNLKGILNFAPVSLSVPKGMHVENVDLTVMLEKAIYFSLYRDEEKNDNQ
jgi:redox-sensing transcriptional repressor